MKKEIIPAKYKTKKSKYFWKKFRKIKGKVKSRRCIDEALNLRDIVVIFDKKYYEILNDNKCQSSCVANDPQSGLAPVTF